MAEEFMMSDSLGKGEINYGKIIYIQIARCIYLGSRTIQRNRDFREEWINAILTFESLLSPKIRDRDAWEITKEEFRNNKQDINNWRKYFDKLMQETQDADLLPAEKVSFYDNGLESV